MTSTNLIKGVFLILSFGVLVGLVLQYPFSVTFPIGGDAAAYIRKAGAVLDSWGHPLQFFHQLNSGWYPLSILIFTSSALIPIAWPFRFIWYMAGAYIVAGILMAKLVHKLFGWQAAAMTMVIWAITTTGTTGFIEDGTLAQLIGLAFLVLFLERVAAKSIWWSLPVFAGVVLTHPINGLALVLTLTLLLPVIWGGWSYLDKQEKRQGFLFLGLVIVFVLGGLLSGKFNSDLFAEVTGVSDSSLLNFAWSKFTPFIFLSPFGLLLLFKQKTGLLAKYLVAMLYSVSLMLAGNEWLGITVWTDRLMPLLVFTVTILSAPALVYLVRTVFRSNVMSTVFLLIFTVMLSVSAGVENDRIFRFYEDPDNVARLHPKELEAIEWMKQNLPADSFVVARASGGSRHAEWIPALTDLKWSAVREESLSDSSGKRYVAFFTFYEDVIDVFLNNPDNYELVYANEAVSIYKVLTKK